MPASAMVAVTVVSVNAGMMEGYAETRPVSPPPSTPAARKRVSSPLMPGSSVTVKRATVRTAPAAPDRTRSAAAASSGASSAITSSTGSDGHVQCTAATEPSRATGCQRPSARKG